MKSMEVFSDPGEAKADSSGFDQNARFNDMLDDGEFPDLSHLGITLQGMGVDEGWEQRVW